MVHVLHVYVHVHLSYNIYMYMHIYNLCVHVLYVHVHVGENKIGGLFQSTHFGAVLTAVQSILHLA